MRGDASVLASGLDITRKDNNGDGFLHLAAAGGASNSATSSLPAGVSSYLIGRGLKANDANRYGWTPLHYAAEKGTRELGEVLHKHGADLNARTKEGLSPYNIAVMFGAKEFAEFIKSKGGDTGPQQFPDTRGEYFGMTPPGRTPVEFAPGRVASRFLFHSNVVFSPDGKEAVWGVHLFGSKFRHRVFGSRMVDGKWTAPAVVPLVGEDDIEDSPFFSPDGRKLYLISSYPSSPETRGGLRIWMLERKGVEWVNPVCLPDVINGMKTIQYQLSVDEKGNLYFGSNAEGGSGGYDVYQAMLVSGKYDTPQNLGAAINGSNWDTSPFIAPDGSYLIFCEQTTMKIVFRRSDGTWSKQVSVTERLGFDGLAPTVTRDGKYFFFLNVGSSTAKPYWVDASFIDELKRETLGENHHRFR